MNRIKKFFIFIIVFLSLVFSAVTPQSSTKAQIIFRQETWYNPSLPGFYTKVHGKGASENDVFGERYTSAQVTWILWTLMTFLPTQIIGPGVMSCGFESLPPPLGLGNIGPDAVFNCLKSLNLVDSKALPTVASIPQQDLIGLILQDKPISLITYVKNFSIEKRLIPEAIAQTGGFGFTSALSPVIPFWRATRNVSYSLFVLIIIAFSFMIMFRVKTSPQTAITIQSAIPKIAITLILITFSYAIAGFMIDLMYVVIGLFSIILSPLIGATPATAFNLLTNGDALGKSSVLGAINLSLSFIGVFFMVLITVIFSVLGLALSAIASIGTIYLLTVATGGIGLLIVFALIAVIALLAIWHAIKILIMLFKAYASIVLLTVFAPLIIALGLVVPALGFSTWLKMIISSLATFVITGVMFLIALYFLFSSLELALPDLANITRVFGFNLADPRTFVSSTAWPPLLGSGGSSGIALLFLGVSFVIYSSIPKADQVMQSLIQGKPFAYGSAAGEVMSPITSPVTGVAKQAVSSTIGKADILGGAISMGKAALSIFK